MSDAKWDAIVIGSGIGGLICGAALAQRFLTDSLRAKTPVQGVYLAGQDVATPGIVGAMMGGTLAAAAIELHIYGHFH